MDAALDAAIRLFTQSLEQSGHDCGELAIRGPAPSSVTKLLSDCVVYQGKNGLEFLTLGLTKDFKAFSYQPHCRLFMILNSAMLMEDPISSDLRAKIAVGQVPRPLVDAHMMKRWIKYIRPVGNTMAAGDYAGLTIILKNIQAELVDVGQKAPAWISQRVNLRECAQEWASGFPGTIGQLLSADVKRMNNLPMTDFVSKLLTDFMAEVQMQGLMERQRDEKA